MSSSSSMNFSGDGNNNNTFSQQNKNKGKKIKKMDNSSSNKYKGYRPRKAIKQVAALPAPVTRHPQQPKSSVPQQPHYPPSYVPQPVPLSAVPLPSPYSQLPVAHQHQMHHRRLSRNGNPQINYNNGYSYNPNALNADTSLKVLLALRKKIEAHQKYNNRVMDHVLSDLNMISAIQSQQQHPQYPYPPPPPPQTPQFIVPNYQNPHVNQFGGGSFQSNAANNYNHNPSYSDAGSYLDEGKNDQ